MKIHKGVTLIELLIVITIVGIISMIAYPSYQNSMSQSRRADAQAALQGLAQAMERFYTTEGTYVGAASGGVPTVFATKSPIDGSDTYYNLKINSASGTAYELEAEPVGVQAGDGILILKSTGARGWDVNNNGTVATTEMCWKKSC